MQMIKKGLDGMCVLGYILGIGGIGGAMDLNTSVVPAVAVLIGSVILTFASKMLGEYSE